MTVTKIRSKASPVKEPLSEDREFLKPLIQTALQEVLEAELNDALSAENGERTQARLGYRSGYYSRFLITRIGKLELRVPGVVLDRAVRTLSAFGEGAGSGAGRDVCARCLDLRRGMMPVHLEVEVPNISEVLSPDNRWSFASLLRGDPPVLALRPGTLAGH